MKRRTVYIACVALGLITTTLWATSRAGPNSPQLTRVNVPKRGFDSAPPMSTDELVQQSQVIATGRCIETHTSWVGRTLFTFATIQVSETLKGQPAQTLTVATPGGVDMNRKIPIGMRVPGAPEFRAQEEVFLFLNPATNAPGFAVTGLAAGKFSVVDDVQGNKIVSDGAVVIHGVVDARGRAKHSLKLEELKEKVKRQLAPQ
jgi:hypothetical protein